jgi:hypothetical protein
MSGAPEVKIGFLDKVKQLKLPLAVFGASLVLLVTVQVYKPWKKRMDRLENQAMAEAIYAIEAKTNEAQSSRH